MNPSESPSKLSLEELRSRLDLSAEQPEEVLLELAQGYAAAPAELRDAVRRVFLEQLVSLPQTPADPAISHFLAKWIEPSDMETLVLSEPEQVLDISERLYELPYEQRAEGDAERVRENIAALLLQSLSRFEAAGDFEKMIRLLQLSPVTIAAGDIGLRRIRNRAYIYEMRRVQRSRRSLYLYLGLQLLLVLFIFPILFVNVENGLIQSQLQDMTEMQIEAEPRQYLSYWDGLYWSLITAASIGYGDLTPQTVLGKSLAAILGVMGVITIGVIAGLILRVVTPRSLD
jgi:hypothetical protein